MIRNAQWMRWYGYPQQLSAAWEQPAADWSGPEWITVPGPRLLSLTTSRILSPKISIPKTSTKNQFEALSEEGTAEPNCDCSVRKERVAAGGPERLPPEDVQMGGGKGGKAIGKC